MMMMMMMVSANINLDDVCDADNDRFLFCDDDYLDRC